MKWQLKLYEIIGVIALTSIICTISAKSVASPSGDGRISIYSYHTNDVLEITFRTPAGYDEAALDKINWVMRSRGDDRIHTIDKKLIDILDNIQDHFGAETVEIISGYRSKPFNEFLRANGRGAASESLHTKGMAADIHIDEVTEKAVWDYVKSLASGGAGYYPRHNFVHVDVGPGIRIWSEPPANNRILTGTELSPNKEFSLLTDKNAYRQGEKITCAISKQAGAKSDDKIDIWYSRFRKGRWSENRLIEKSKRAIKLSGGKTFTYTWKPKDLAYGKYRFVVFPSRDASVAPVYSNEFYIKK